MYTNLLKITYKRNGVKYQSIAPGIDLPLNSPGGRAKFNSTLLAKKIGRSEVVATEHFMGRI